MFILWSLIFWWLTILLPKSNCISLVYWVLKLPFQRRTFPRHWLILLPTFLILRTNIWAILIHHILLTSISKPIFNLFDPLDGLLIRAFLRQSDPIRQRLLYELLLIHIVLPLVYHLGQQHLVIGSHRAVGLEDDGLREYLPEMVRLLTPGVAVVQGRVVYERVPEDWHGFGFEVAESQFWDAGGSFERGFSIVVCDDFDWFF